MIKRRFEELEELKQAGFEPYAYVLKLITIHRILKTITKNLSKKTLKLLEGLWHFVEWEKPLLRTLQDKEWPNSNLPKKDEIGEAI